MNAILFDLGRLRTFGWPRVWQAGLGAPIWLQLSRAAAGDKSRNMSVSVEAETQAPDLHDLVTKRDQNEFVWDHQFTVKKTHNKLNKDADLFWFDLIDHELTFSIYLDDVWYKLFSLGAYILGNWKVDKTKKGETK